MRLFIVNGIDHMCSGSSDPCQIDSCHVEMIAHHSLLTISLTVLKLLLLLTPHRVNYIFLLIFILLVDSDADQTTSAVKDFPFVLVIQGPPLFRGPDS